jgi:hypothetical protein
MGPCRFTRVLALCHPVVIDLDICTQVPTHEGPLRSCSLLASLRKGRFPFFMPSPAAESGFKVQRSKFKVGTTTSTTLVQTAGNSDFLWLGTDILSSPLYLSAGRTSLPKRSI